jgi:hypothetical protein
MRVTTPDSAARPTGYRRPDGSTDTARALREEMSPFYGLPADQDPAQLAKGEMPRAAGPRAVPRPPLAVRPVPRPQAAVPLVQDGPQARRPPRRFSRSGSRVPESENDLAVEEGPVRYARRAQAPIRYYRPGHPLRAAMLARMREAARA